MQKFPGFFAFIDKILSLTTIPSHFFSHDNNICHSYREANNSLCSRLISPTGFEHNSRRKYYSIAVISIGSRKMFPIIIFYASPQT